MAGRLSRSPNTQQNGIPLVSVVCLSYERRGYVLELLTALQLQDYPNIEVILVDNNSQDGTADAVESAYPKTQVIRCPQNFGMVAYNFGFANAKGHYVFVLDDDALPASSTWITESVRQFEANPRLGALACTIRMADTGRVGYDNPQYLLDEVRDGGYAAVSYNGTGAGLRAEALHRTNYYPFHFFRSWLELSLCTQLIETGWEVRYFPALEVWHRRTTGSINRPITYYGLRNYFWYVWTFYPQEAALKETVRYFGYCLKLVKRGRMKPGLLVRSWFASCAGWSCIAHTRKPVSQATIAYLHRVRQSVVNDGLAPTQRHFTDSWEHHLADVA